MSKFHINKHGVPAPCKAVKGNCPYGGSDGTENHFDTVEEAQSAADKNNGDKYGTLPEMTVKSKSAQDFHGNFVGTYYTMTENSGNALMKEMDKENVSLVFRSGFENGELTTTHERYSRDNTPINFNSTVKSIGEDEYELKGSISEYSYEERDFDTREDYEDYLKEDPEVREVSFKFTGDDLKQALIREKRLDRSTHASQTPGILIHGLYSMAKDK